MNLIPLGRKSASQNDITFDETTILSDEFMKIDKRCIIIFPEGTRGKANVLNRFRKGPSRLAIGLNKPILPAVIKGTGESWPKGKIFFKPGKIRVYILEAIYPESFINGKKLNKKNTFNAAKEMTNEIENKIKNKLEELKLNE